MGPRGCGKTTLLKMLTRRAQRVWQNERAPVEPAGFDYRRPEFEAIYIPSDIRWSAELLSVAKELADFPVDAERVQRASVAICSLVEATKAFEQIVIDGGTEPPDLLKAMIRHLELGPTFPSFREIRFKLLGWVENIQNGIVKRDLSFVREYLDSLPAVIMAHSLSAVTKACKIFYEYASAISPSRWALCYDELEIAPQWLQKELFLALRSFDQQFLLKLTWSPVLPTDLMPHQERQQDYLPIRMWHGHVADARPFCNDFSTRFLRETFGDQTITPRTVFGPSPFAQEESESDESYGRGTEIWQAIVQLAKQDGSFREYLTQHGISPEDPTTETVAIRDESLRKVKPIVLLREAFLKDSGGRVIRRSRKNPLLYYGEDSVYAMSEGNPRLLAGLLNELVDVERKGVPGRFPIVRPDAQSRVLHTASQRMMTTIKTYPLKWESRRFSLSRLINRLGLFLQSELVGRHFKPDPVGSFFVDEDVTREIEEEIRAGLLIGALVHVKTPEEDIPTSVMGSRIRLSYVLAPHFQLLFRNFREMRLSTALRIYSSSQRTLFRVDGE
jgi:hypothetical protein